MPTGAHIQRACAMCESYPACVAPERARCARATPRAWRQSDTSSPPDTVRQRDTTRPPDTPPPPGQRAPARCVLPPGHAAAPRTPRASAMRAATWTRRCPSDTARQLDASRPPETPLPPPTRPATEPARVPQSTAPPCCIHTTLSAPRCITFMRRSRTDHESGARHRANLVSECRVERGSAATPRGKKKPGPLLWGRVVATALQAH